MTPAIQGFRNGYGCVQYLYFLTPLANGEGNNREETCMSEEVLTLEKSGKFKPAKGHRLRTMA